MDVRETQNRLGKVTTYGHEDDEEELVGSGGRSRFKTAEQLASRKEQRKRYQFEATASDDELEDELDGNLDEIGDAAKRLKALGLAMGQELDNQNKRIDVIEGKAVRTEQKIHLNTERVRQFNPLITARNTYELVHRSSRESSSRPCMHIPTIAILTSSRRLCKMICAVTDESCDYRDIGPFNLFCFSSTSECSPDNGIRL